MVMSVMAISPVAVAFTMPPPAEASKVMAAISCWAAAASRCIF